MVYLSGAASFLCLLARSSPLRGRTAAHLERQPDGRSFFAGSTFLSLAAQYQFVTIWKPMRVEVQLA
jgi:hypothetical protein